MRFGSVCSGIEAASVAWHPLGWEAAWLSEIEPFPCAVLKHHYPDVPNYGDMTLLPDRILSGEVEAPDLFCGGTPCQAFSVAGLRNSLDDARGNLSLTFVGIANAIDHVRSVRRDASAIIFWENVPGVLNTKDNAFGCFLGALAGESEPIIAPGDKWSNAGCVFGPQRAIAWRVLDAQYFGLAQRRKRVFVVASARNDFDPATVLFEFDGLRRDTAPSRETGQNITKPITDSVGALCARDYKGVGNQYVAEGKVLPVWWNGGNLAATITTKSDDQRMPDKANAQLIMQQVYENHPADSRVKDMGDTCTTVTSRWGTGGGNVPLAVDVYNQTIDGDVAATLTEACGGSNTSGPKVMQQAYGIQGSMIGRQDHNGPQGDGVNEEVSFTLNTIDRHAVVATMAVRRLTPVECERLQGFPDDYTNIPWRKKPESPDGPRYKALGNSWAVPVVAWIGKRINDAAA